MTHRTLLPLLLALALLPACAEEEGCPEAPQCEGGVLNESAGLCWQQPRAEGVYLWQEAIDYCEGLVLAGHDDWFLPAYDDFRDLFEECGTKCPACEESERCNSLFCPKTKGDFWAICPDLEPGCSFILDLGDGLEPEGYSDEAKLSVCCVRVDQ